MMKRIILLSLVSICLFACNSEDEDKIIYPNVSGNWEGFLDAEGWDTVFFYSIDLTQNNHAIEGNSLIKYNDTTYARMTLWGTVGEDGSVVFEESKIIEKYNEVVVGQWCKKSVDALKLTTDQPTILGTWKDIDCNHLGGNINLKKQ